jgi:hypothetical protein
MAKAQRIDLSKLRLPLKYFPDDLSVQGGRPGHGVIAPVDEAGRVDDAALEEWASSRATQGDTPHRLTQIVIDAIVDTDVRRS